jgi:hypothetical protein
LTYSRQFLVIAGTIAPSILLAKAIEGAGGLWKDSEYFFLVFFSAILFRIFHRIIHGDWKFRHEWFAFIFVFPLILGAYIWIRIYETLFLLVGGALFVLWATYVREMVMYLESRD